MTFEQYAERLSVEADQLRGKIGKEQKETKRLSGLVSLTAAEKAKLQLRECSYHTHHTLATNNMLGLTETEVAHKDALIELQRMRETMERMEEERAEMVAEVEAQIERALASMAVDVDESDYCEEIDSRPASRMSAPQSTRGARSRRASDAVKSNCGEGTTTRLRSVGTESTLAESFEGMDDTLVHGKTDRDTTTITEEEEISVSPSRKKRFSATQEEIVQDGMMAVDEGISERSDRIAQKVLQIQQKVSNEFAPRAIVAYWDDSKLETALASERIQDWKNRSFGRHGTGSGYGTDERGEESSDAAIPVRTRPPRGTKLINNPPARVKRRERSDTTSTNQTGSATTITRGSLDAVSTPRRSPSLNLGETIPRDLEPEAVETRTSATEDTTSTPTTETRPLRKIASGASLSALSPEVSVTAPPTPALTPAVSSTTDDSDTEFQSAYSTSPRDSYGSFESNKLATYNDSDDSGNATDRTGERHVTEFTKLPRERLSSAVTAILQAQPSPTASDVTVSPRARLPSMRRQETTT